MTRDERLWRQQTLEKLFMSIDAEGNVLCHECGRTLITLKHEGEDTNRIVAVHAIAHLRDLFDSLPEKADELHGLLNLVVKGIR